jgi:serum/glucocorticoid-regulated kinase 2
MFEIIFNFRPYSGKNRREVREAILEKQVKINLNSIPENWSHECIDFINNLLKRKPTNRIGKSGIQEIKSHEWLRDINFHQLKDFKLKPPFIPNGLNNFDEDYINSPRKVNPSNFSPLNLDYFGYYYSPSQFLNN